MRVLVSFLLPLYLAGNTHFLGRTSSLYMYVKIEIKIRKLRVKLKLEVTFYTFIHLLIHISTTSSNFFSFKKKYSGTNTHALISHSCIIFLSILGTKYFQFLWLDLMDRYIYIVAAAVDPKKSMIFVLNLIFLCFDIAQVICLFTLCWLMFSKYQQL